MLPLAQISCERHDKQFKKVKNRISNLKTLQLKSSFLIKINENVIHKHKHKHWVTPSVVHALATWGKYNTDILPPYSKCVAPPFMFTHQVLKRGINPAIPILLEGDRHMQSPPKGMAGLIPLFLFHTEDIWVSVEELDTICTVKVSSSQPFWPSSPEPDWHTVP